MEDAMKLKLALTLITIAQMLLFLLVLRRKKAEKWTVKGGVLFVCFPLFAALCAWTFTSGMTVLRPRETVTVTALNQKNDLAKSESIYLTGIAIDNRESTFSAEEKNGWHYQNKWLVIRSDEYDFDASPNLNTELPMPAGTGRYLTFYTNQHKGLVQVDYQEQTQIVDCYSEKDGTVNVYLRDSDYDTLHSMKIRQLAVFFGMLLVFNMILLWAELRSVPRTTGGFTKENSLSLKGAAILMMLWHHCFLSGRYKGFQILFYPFSQTQVEQIAAFFKICVPLFAFISGYGLLQTVLKGKDPVRCDSRWVLNRLYRLLKNYWFVVAAAWIVTFLIDRRPVSIYKFNDSILLGVWNMITDFFGIRHLFGQDPLTGTWWYMSAAVMYVILFPVLFASFRKFGSLITILLVSCLPWITGSGFPGGTNFVSFLPAFTMGMAFAWGGWFDRLDQFRNNRSFSGKPFCSFLLRFLPETVLLALCCNLYSLLPTDQYWNFKYLIVPVVVVLWLRDFVMHSPVRTLDTILVFLGKHATNIFLIHTFIRAYYLPDLTYGWGHFGLTLLFLLASSLALSYMVELLKKLTKYDQNMDRLFEKRTKKASR